MPPHVLFTVALALVAGSLLAQEPAVRARTALADLERATLRSDEAAREEAVTRLEAVFPELQRVASGEADEALLSRCRDALRMTRGAIPTDAPDGAPPDPEAPQPELRGPEPAPAEPAPPEGGLARAGAGELGARMADKLLHDAVEFARTFPADREALRDRYLAIAERYPGTDAALAAEMALVRLEQEDAVRTPERPAPDLPAGADGTEPVTPNAADTRPHWERIRDRLAALELPRTRNVRRDVRELLLALDHVEAYDRVRRALAAAAEDGQKLELDPGARRRSGRLYGELLRMLERVEEAQLLLALVVTEAPRLVGQTHVFRLRDGEVLPASVLGYDAGAFRVGLVGEEDERELHLRELSPVGFVQIATRSREDAAYLAAAAHFLLLGELESMERYLELAERRGLDTREFAARAALSREIAALSDELAPARNAWRQVESAFRTFLAETGRGSHLTALAELKRILPQLHDADLPALDAIALEERGLGFVELLHRARTACDVVHREPEEHLVTCGTCGGDGHHALGFSQDPILHECEACKGTGRIPCRSCSARFRDRALRELEGRAAELLPR